GETPAGAGGDGFDLDLVLAGAGGRAVRQQVVAPRRRLDAGADLVEALLHVAGVLRGEGARAPDARELAPVDLLSDADDVGLEPGALQRAIDLLRRGAVGAIGAVGEDH